MSKTNDFRVNQWPPSTAKMSSKGTSHPSLLSMFLNLIIEAIPSTREAQKTCRFSVSWGVADWLQDVVEHQIGRGDQRTLGVRRVVCQVRRLEGAIVNSMAQDLLTYPILFPQHKAS